MVAAMQKAAVTRRAIVLALPAVASLPLGSGAALASAATSSSGLPAELPSDRVARLALELSEALNELDGRKSFVTVYPSDCSEDPIRYGDIADAFDAAGTVSAGLMQAIVRHCAASAAVLQAARQADPVALGREASRGERHRLEQASEVERELLLALCCFPTQNDPERHDKATYLLGFCDGDELEREHVIAILESMTATPDEGDAGVARVSGLDRRV